MPACARASLACITCRKSKAKCDGKVPAAIASPSSRTLSTVPADLPCSRCQRLDRICQWKAAHRTGRPKTRPQAESSTSSQSTISTPFEAQMSPLPAFDQDLYDLAIQSLDQDALNLFSFGFEEEGISVNEDLPDLTSLLVPTSEHNEANTWQPGTSLNDQAMGIATPHINDEEQNRLGSLRLGVQRYFQSIGRSSPLLGLEVDFMNRIDNCEGVLVEAVSALGHLFFEGCESQAYTHARQRSIVLTSIEPPQEDAQRIIDFITALILVTYVEYGDDNIEQASLYLQKACKMALYYGLNILDHNAQEGHLHESHFIRISNNDAHLIGLGRRVWWELFLADVVLHISTSGRIKRNLGSLEVNIASAPCIPGTKDQDPYEMRIKGALLAAEIVGSQEILLSSMDSIISNLIINVQERWLSYSKRLSQRLGQSSEGISNKMAQKVLFQTLLMLHAGRLHLHRQAWFPQVSFEYESCSFAPDHTSNIVIQENQVQKTSSSMMNNSLAQIVNSSSAILGLMQLDSEEHFRLAQQESLSSIPLVSPHWPFIGCCQMVASYGFALASSSTSTNISSLQQSLGKQMTTSATSKTTDIWKIRENISNTGFAEASLGNLMQVWKVSKTYRDQVHRCRIGLEQDLGNVMMGYSMIDKE